MKLIAATIFISLWLPALIFSQPLISNLEPHQQAEQQPAASISESDFIRPVLMRDQTSPAYDNSIQKLFTEKPGLALLSSGLIPGSGQFVNKNWIRGGLYAALEVAAIYMVVEFDNRGDRGKRRYETYADQNWSVTQYAKWLVDYHDVNGLDNSALENLRTMVDGVEPAFDTDTDWNNIDLDILRAVERQSRFVTPDNLSNSNFSHILPAYGSQQYYELISKYYQFQSGWQDYYSFHEANSTSPFLISRDGTYASNMFFRGASLADDFNNDFRTSKNFRLILIANHVLSAFDSFFTFKLKQNQVQATTSMAPSQYLQLKVNF
ncbi:hypothetical protein [Rhodohalobacter sp. 8-1]|uniref:hypothetical protein n=1 Tax=Rhodohalobacter sp. 8-1 TaxID=3131972 RepID=UPI0030EC6CE5